MTRSLVWQLTMGLAAIALLTIGPAILQGRYTNRWQIPSELSVDADALARFPTHIGSWEAAERGDPLPTAVTKELGIVSYLSRFYRRHNSDDAVLLLLMVGQPGRLLRHTPNICFANQANTLLDESQIDVAPEAGKSLNKTSVFRLLKYRPDSKLRDPFRVAYAFTTDGTWAVPKLPRLSYGGCPALYKAHIQAIEPFSAAHSGELPIEDFVHQFVLAFTEFQQEESASPQ
jgi:Protein of unknown function (DUF3485)